MPNITTETLGSGCILYYMNIGAAITKLSDELSENMTLICTDLAIDVNQLKEESSKKEAPEASWTSQSCSTNIR